MFKTSQSTVRRDLLFTLIFLSTIFAFQVLGQTTNPARSRSSMRTENGAQRLLFAFPAGRLVVNLPDDIRPGDTISGTVSNEPLGATEAEKTKNLGVLEGYVIDLGDGTKVRADKGSFIWHPRLASPNMPDQYLVPVQVFEPSAMDAAAGVYIALSRSVVPGPATFTLPFIGQNGRAAFITGPFDGDSSNTKCAMGDTSCVVIAESPRGAVFNTPNSVIGETTLTVGEGKTSTSGAFRNINIGLSAPKTSLLKGEKTTLAVQVLGLSGIKEPLTVQMVTTGPVNTDGGNNQNIEIKPSQVKGDGTFSITRDLTAIEAGPFNVAVSLIGSP